METIQDTSRFNFYLDRQFGHAIFLQVEKGIIKEFAGNSKLEEKFKEVFVGKPILDFSMQYVSVMPSHHRIHATELYLIHDKVNHEWSKNNYLHCELINAKERKEASVRLLNFGHNESNEKLKFLNETKVVSVNLLQVACNESDERLALLNKELKIVKDKINKEHNINL